MAGGPLAREVMCPTCAFDDFVITRARRVVEGVEDDRYRCERGHAFGLDFRRGPATEPQWPPPADEVAAIEAMKRGA